MFGRRKSANSIMMNIIVNNTDMKKELIMNLFIVAMIVAKIENKETFDCSREKTT